MYNKIISYKIAFTRKVTLNIRQVYRSKKICLQKSSVSNNAIDILLILRMIKKEFSGIDSLRYV